MMEQEKKLSIVIIVYKVEQYFRQCLDSVISQTYKNLEIILVIGLKDGKCVDGCKDIALEYAEKDKRIKIVECEANGPADARNNGVSNVSGDLLGFVDSDDYIEPDMFETMINNLYENNAQISVCGRFYEFKNISKEDSGSKKVMTSSEALKSVISYDGFFLHCWDKIYTRDVFEGIYFPTDSFVEDRIVVDKLIAKADRICYDPTPKYHFRERSGSLSKSDGMAKKNEIANDRLICFIKENYPELKKECGRFNLYETITCLQNALVYEGENKSEVKRYQKKIQDIMKEEADNELISKKIRIKAWLAVYMSPILKILTIRSLKTSAEELVRFE